MTGSVMSFFGDIFKLRGESLVFLGQTKDMVYAATILSPELTKRVVEVDDRQAAQPTSHRSDGNKYGSYIILRAEDFLGCAAHYGGPGYDRDRIEFNWTGQSVTEEDKKELKEAILKRENYVDKGLRGIFLKM